MATESKKIRRDPFIKSVRPDPTSSDELVLLQGYIGDSDLPGHIRIYADAGLSNSIDVPENDVLHSTPIEAAEDPIGGSRLWVKKSTVYSSGDAAQGTRIKSTFLEGDLMRRYSDIGGAGYHEGPGGVGNSVGCISAGNTACITNNAPCPSVGICPVSIQVLCNQTINRPSCFRTCFQVSCVNTCVQPSCFRTCFNPTCRVTCARPTCFRTCFRTCQFICDIVIQRSRVCEIEVDYNPIPNPYQDFGRGYTGGFDPYQTGY